VCFYDGFMRTTIGFKSSVLPEHHDKYIGKWVMLSLRGQSTQTCGLVKSVQDGYMVLSPFVSADYSSGSPVRVFSQEQTELATEAIDEASLTTRENLEAQIKFLNSKDAKR